MDEYRRADISCIPERIRDRMLTGEMKCLLPMSVTEEEGRLIAIYSLFGFSGISDMKFSPTGILEVCERIFRMIEELKDCLIWPEDIVLNREIIFLDPRERETRICLIPGAETAGGKDNVSYLLKELKSLTDKDGEAYLDYLIREYMNRALTCERIFGLIEDLKREAGSNGII